MISLLVVRRRYFSRWRGVTRDQDERPDASHELRDHYSRMWHHVRNECCKKGDRILSADGVHRSLLLSLNLSFRHSRGGLRHTAFGSRLWLILIPHTIDLPLTVLLDQINPQPVG